MLIGINKILWKTISYLFQCFSKVIWHNNFFPPWIKTTAIVKNKFFPWHEMFLFLCNSEWPFHPYDLLFAGVQTCDIESKWVKRNFQNSWPSILFDDCFIFKKHARLSLRTLPLLPCFLYVFISYPSNY